jgi:hypothetical protein
VAARRCALGLPRRSPPFSSAFRRSWLSVLCPCLGQPRGYRLGARMAKSSQASVPKERMIALRFGFTPRPYNGAVSEGYATPLRDGWPSCSPGVDVRNGGGVHKPMVGPEVGNVQTEAWEVLAGGTPGGSTASGGSGYHRKGGGDKKSEGMRGFQGLHLRKLCRSRPGGGCRTGGWACQGWWRPSMGTWAQVSRGREGLAFLHLRRPQGLSRGRVPHAAADAPRLRAVQCGCACRSTASTGHTR